jgi:hypothetical protein
MHDKVKAAAERIIRVADITIQPLTPFGSDVRAVASYALEAGREVERLRETLQRAGAGLAATYVLLNRDGDHDGAEACMDMIGEIDAALSTHGEPGSSGGG